jgi:hypothetical protein
VVFFWQWLLGGLIGGISYEKSIHGKSFVFK